MRVVRRSEREDSTERQPDGIPSTEDGQLSSDEGGKAIPLEHLAHATPAHLDDLETLAQSLGGDLGAKELAEVKMLRARHRLVPVPVYRDVRAKLLGLQSDRARRATV